MRGKPVSPEKRRAVTNVLEYFKKVTNGDVDIFKGEVKQHVANCLNISLRSVHRITNDRRPADNDIIIPRETRGRRPTVDNNIVEKLRRIAFHNSRTGILYCMAYKVT